MKSVISKLSFVLILVVLFSSCSTSDILPKSSEAHQNLYGSYIELDLKRSSKVPKVVGELISVNDSSIFIIHGEDGEVDHVEVMLDQVQGFRVYLFEPQYPVWSNLALSLLPLSHGIVGVVSLPVNVVTMGVVNGQVKDRASHTDYEIPLSELYHFARFPQGFPPNLKFEELKAAPARKKKG